MPSCRVGRRTLYPQHEGRSPQGSGMAHERKAQGGSSGTMVNENPRVRLGHSTSKRRAIGKCRLLYPPVEVNVRLVEQVSTPTEMSDQTDRTGSKPVLAKTQRNGFNRQMLQHGAV